MLAQDLEKKLKNNCANFHNFLETFGINLYKQYKQDNQKAAETFLKTGGMLRKIILGDLSKRGLNEGSIAGVISEWYFYYIIKGLIEAEQLSTIKVYNGYRRPYKWKRKGNKQIKV